MAIWAVGARKGSARPLLTSLTSGSLFLFGALMAANVVAYGYQMVIARLLGPSEYGLVVTLTSVSYVLLVVMRSVQAWAIAAVRPSHAAPEGRVRGAFAAGLPWLGALAALSLGGLWLAAPWVAGFLRLTGAAPLSALGMYVASSFLVPLPRGALLGLGWVRHAAVAHLVEPAVRLAAGTALVLAGLGATGAVMAFAAGNVVAAAVALVPLLPLLLRASRGAASSTDVPAARLDRYALWVLAVNAALTVAASLDQVAVRHYFSDEVAGNYALAFTLGRVIAMTALALGWVVFARAAALPPNDPAQRRLCLRSMLAVGGFGLALTGVFLLLPGPVVRMMGGGQYGAASAYVGLVGVEMTLFALVYVQTYHRIAMGDTAVAWPLGVAIVLEALLLAARHVTIVDVLTNLIFVMALLLVAVSALSWRARLSALPDATAVRERTAGVA